MRAVFHTILWLSLTMFFCANAQAQQREFYNGGFEQNDPRGPGAPTFEQFPNIEVPEWTDQTGLIELWDSGFQSVTSYEGNVHAEMNARANGVLYQEVCLINGETIGWSFAHRARVSGGAPNPQRVRLQIADLAGVTIQNLDTASSAQGDPWELHTDSRTYNGPTGVQRVQFRALTTSSLGNFIDALSLDIAAFAEFSGVSSSNPEADGINAPQIILDGRVEVETTIPFTITGGTADGSDYILNDTEVTIPVGLYNAQAFPLPITIPDDLDDEPDETIEITLGTPSTGEIQLTSSLCDGSSAQTTVTHTIINDDTTLSGVKTVETVDSSGNPSYALPGNEAVYTITVANTGSEPVDTDTLFLVDTLPAELQMFTGDFDGAGPGIGAVSFTETNSGLIWDPVSSYGFSDQVTKPIDMSECNYAPAALYDPAVRYICFAPNGSFASADPDPEFAVSFRLRIP